jgi:hypothetical protein
MYRTSLCKVYGLCYHAFLVCENTFFTLVLCIFRGQQENLRWFSIFLYFFMIF